MSKEINLNIDFTDIDMSEVKESKVKVVIDHMEQAVASCYQEEKRPNKIISREEQRKLDKLMEQLDKNKNGIAILDDVSYAYLVTKWRERNYTVAVGDLRRILVKIDKLLCPE